MSSKAVYLTKLPVKRNGKTYEYWLLQWRDGSGKMQTESIGSTKKLSKRQAEKLRREKEHEFAQRPGRRNVPKAPTLGDYLEMYIQNRRCELKPGTLEWHIMTKRYLEGFFSSSQRIDSIQRQDARAFKAALAEGKLKHVSKRPRDLSMSAVHTHIRNANTMFNIALEDDKIKFNPFVKVAGKAPPAKAWHLVTDDEFQALMLYARANHRLLFALCRLAALRRGEALALRWDEIDWKRSRLKVIANEEWQPKDRDFRIVPIVPELMSMLLEAFEGAEPGQETVIPTGGVSTINLSRDFTRLCKRAGIKRWKDPTHTLRKTCTERWAETYPAHVVAEWAGHSDIETTRKHYLQVTEDVYNKAAGLEPEKSDLSKKTSKNLGVDK